MSTRQLRLFWAKLRANYWFVPTTIIGLSFGLAYLMLTLDSILPTKYVINLGWIYTRNATGAWELLSVTSQSMITVAGVVFSITTVALTFASNQFGTRVLRNFIHDLGSQIVFGVFLGTFIYCLLVMRRVEPGDPGFVPSLSVAVGIFLAVASTFTLVYFIHHVIVGLEAETIVARLATDLRKSVDTLFPERLGKDEVRTKPERRFKELPADFEERSCSIAIQREGFVSNIRNDYLLEVASKHDLIVQVLSRPGTFVFETLAVAKAWPQERVDEEVVRKIRKSFDIKRQRTFEQDLAFAFQQLVLLTTRALSPAINGLGTAMDGIEYVAGAFVLIGGRKIPSTRRYDENDNLRILAEPWRLDRIADDVLNPLRQAAASQPTVMAHLLRATGTAIEHTINPELRRRLRQHVTLMELASRNFPQPVDRAEVEKIFKEALNDEPAA